MKPKQTGEHSWTIEVQKDGKTEELFIELPPEALAQVGWDIGDELVWEEMPGTEAWSIRKKSEVESSDESTDEDDPLEGMEQSGC